MKEITIEEFSNYSSETIQLVDIRDEGSVLYGMIPGAVHISFSSVSCHFTETCSTCHEDGTTSSKRLETKKLIAKLKEENPFIEGNIFKSVENVNLDTVIEYKQKGVRHNFLDNY